MPVATKYSMSVEGDRRRRQPEARVSVVGRVGQQVALAQVAVEFLAEAVDDGGVRLQPHALAQPVDEHAGDQRPLVGRGGFLLDHGREYQRLVRRLDRQVRRATPPRRLELALQAPVRLKQQFAVAGAAREAIRIGKELAFRMLSREADPGHPFLLAQAAQFDRHLRMRLDRCQRLARGPALGERQRVQQHVTRHELVEECRRRGARQQFVLAGLYARRGAGARGMADPGSRVVQDPPRL
jgi:hypothetical protein